MANSGNPRLVRRDKVPMPFDMIVDYRNFYGKNMMKLFHTFQKQDNFCDITINIGGRSFHAHKMVLAAASPYFESMFLGAFVESSKSTVDIDGDGWAFEKLLEYAYTGDLADLHLTEDTIVGVLKLACYMQFEKIVDECSQHLYKYLNDGDISCEDALTLAVLASSYGDPVKRLLRCVVRAIALKFVKFVKVEIFLEGMHAEVFDQILLEPTLALSTKEEEILNSMIRWLSHDVSTRKQHAAKLLKTLHLGVIPAVELEKAGDFFDKHNMAECCEILRRIVKKRQAKSGGSSKGADSDELHDMFTPRNIVTGSLSIGGLGENTIVYFNKKDKTWVDPPLKFPTPPTNIAAMYPSITAIVVDDVLYVAEGNEEYEEVDEDNEDLWTKLWKYDPDSNSWKELAGMKSMRSKFALVHQGGFIYAVGGMIGSDLVKTVERYDIGRNKWKFVAPTRCFHENPKAVVLNGKILAYGLEEVDKSGQACDTYSLEMYDPGNNVWRKLASEKYRTFENPLLTVQDGKCYRLVHKLDESKTMEEECASEGEGELHISRITIKERRNGQVMAVIGKKEKQEPMMNESHMFCLNGKVFVYLSRDYQYILNTGIDVVDIGENGLEQKWKKMYVLCNQRLKVL
ncbi:kelch-like protein 28 [Amphiura filiformis]|uniref:kelch-like protein 28 n=1 Tax=Amphiura filiformis TaxID=82378 RepID=UPI003B222ED6